MNAAEADEIVGELRVLGKYNMSSVDVSNDAADLIELLQAQLTESQRLNRELLQEGLIEMKLTSERVNGIKSGYWSPAKKEELTQKLGAIEYQAPRLLDNICKGICLHRMPQDKDSDEVCRGCPVNELTALISR